MLGAAIHVLRLRDIGPRLASLQGVARQGAMLQGAGLEALP
jgi:hypothetical protein